MCIHACSRYVHTFNFIEFLKLEPFWKQLHFDGRTDGRTLVLWDPNVRKKVRPSAGIYEFAMKNGNFIIFFGKFRQKRVILWWARWNAWVWLEGQIFPEYAFFFAQGIGTFFVSCLEKNGENAPFFWCPFFGFARVSFKKTAKRELCAF